MKTTVELDQKDVIKILAEHFKVDKSKITISLGKTWVGQGPMEHEITTVKVTIDASEYVPTSRQPRDMLGYNQATYDDPV